MWTIRPDPPRTGPVTAAVALADSTGGPIRGADVDLEATMTHPGMRPEMASAAEVAPGRYEADLILTMGGDWMLIMHAELPDGRTLQHQKELDGVRGEEM